MPVSFVGVFGGTTISAVREQETTVVPLPVFKPRWWHRVDRLDARPVVWSLDNRPDDWVCDCGDYVLTHKRSGHSLWIANGYGLYSMQSPGCGCTSRGGAFQRFQQRAIHRAVRRWLSRHMNPDRFVAHFVRPVE